MGYQKLSIQQELQLVEDYKNGMPVEEVRKKYGFKTRKSVTDKVKKYFPTDYKDIIKENHDKIKGYSYSFEKIKSEFDAYFLGLLLTDGYVTPRGTDIGIDLIDEDCIKFLSQVIGKKYSCYPPSGKLSKQPRYRLILSIGSEVKNAERLGITKNKTFTLQPPRLLEEEKKFIPYIVRGIIDGDGCIYQTSNGGPSVSVVSASKDFISWLKYIFENVLFLKNIFIKNISKNEKPLYQIATAEIDNVQKIIALCYNKPFGMNRKYTKIRQMFRDYNKDFFMYEEDGIVQTATEMAQETKCGTFQ